ncbi:MAG: hypothetical protein IT545_06750 [Rhodobacteraceae bacterium]|nr:hypothetical protein [Paracoccaceae bacterium]
MRRVLRVLGWLLILGGLAPMLLAIVASAIARRHGCTLHEGFPGPCLIGGEDWGEALHAMGLLAWLAIATAPLAVVGILLLLGLWVARRLARR